MTVEQRVFKSDICTIICVGIALRGIVSLHSYSGAGNPPIYGDYEAQRHWQEITVNLDPHEWYTNSSNNDLLYWGLDYPPLTAYHSLVMGKVANALNYSYIELYSSRGIESSHHKSFMRYSVLTADLLVFIPSALLLAIAIRKFIHPYSLALTLGCLLVFVTYPGQILIDNGHFQYNNISLGLTTLAIACILEEYNLLATVVFTLALNYKQMELYHSIPFFIYLLRKCTDKKRPITYFIKVGGLVLLTCILLWHPWLFSLDSTKVVLNRIFPLARGVFEDKVANFWCAANVLIKIKLIFQNHQISIICLIVTLISLIPSATNLFQNSTKRNFVYSLMNCALSFFLFSFQVHEKSILLPALPALVLYTKHPYIIRWFLQITTYSMIPLLNKDDLTLSCFVLQFIFHSVMDLTNCLNCNQFLLESKKIKFLYKLSSCMFFVLITAFFFAPSPKHLPDLYTLMLMMFSFLHFLMFFLYFTFIQLFNN